MMTGRVKPLRSAILLAILTAVPAFAEEGGLKEPSEIWKWLNFFILVGILGYLVSKNLGPMLSDRTKKIQEGLAAGEKAKAEADARAAAVQAKLSDLDFQVSLIRDGAKQDRERETERIRRDAEREIERIQQHAAQEIESAAKLARLEVQRFAAKAAIELAEQKVRVRMSPEVESALLGSFLDDLANGRRPSEPGN
jgi:F-type H+-transporting ATPase subunit b